MALLRMIKGPTDREYFELDASQKTIGRDVECHVVLPVRKVSRRHAQIVQDFEGNFHIEDLGSLNGTFVNGIRVGGRTRLRNRDCIEIGDIALLFYEQPPDESDSSGPNRIVTHSRRLMSRVSPPPFDRVIDVVSDLPDRADINAAAKLRAILEISRNLGSSLEVEILLPKILDSIFRIFPQADRTYITLGPSAGKDSEMCAFRTRDSDSDETITIGPVSGTITAWVMSEGKAVLSIDACNDPRFGRSQSVLEIGIRCMMCAPLMGPSQRPLGVIHVDTRDLDREFTEPDLDVLVSIAALAGQAVEHAQIHRARLEEQKLAEEAIARARDQLEHRVQERTAELLATNQRLQREILERKQAEAALRESEQKFMDVFYASDDAILLSDGDRFIDCNEAAVRMLGAADKSDVLAMHPSELSPPVQSDGRSSVEMANEIVSRAFEGGSYRFEWIHRRANGEPFPVEVILTRIPLKGRQVLHCVWKDLTDLKRAEEEIRRLNSEMPHASRVSMMGELIAGIAHEVHQPLAVIANYANGCIRRIESESIDRRQIIDLMKEVVNESMRAGEILRRIRNFIQKKEPQRRAVDVKTIIRDAVELSGFDLRRREVEIEIRHADDLPPVFVDDIRIIQVVLNLLLNGIEALADGDGERKLTIETRPLSRDFVQVAVADNGPGIAPEFQEKIFDQFVTNKPHGLGMGLAISRSIIKDHNGEINVSSQLGEGTTFHFTLPTATAGRIRESEADAD